MLPAKLMQPSSANLAGKVYYPSPRRKVLISADVAELRVTTADAYFILTISAKVQATTPKKDNVGCNFLTLYQYMDMHDINIYQYMYRECLHQINKSIYTYAFRHTSIFSTATNFDLSGKQPLNSTSTPIYEGLFYPACKINSLICTGLFACAIAACSIMAVLLMTRG